MWIGSDGRRHCCVQIDGKRRSLGDHLIKRRRFPPPWSVEELDACFVVKDGSGQKLSYVYFEDEPGKLLRKDEARRIAAAGICFAIAVFI